MWCRFLAIKNYYYYYWEKINCVHVINKNNKMLHKIHFYFSRPHKIEKVAKSIERTSHHNLSLSLSFFPLLSLFSLRMVLYWRVYYCGRLILINTLLVLMTAWSASVSFMDQIIRYLKWSAERVRRDSIHHVWWVITIIYYY